MAETYAERQKRAAEKQRLSESLTHQEAYARSARARYGVNSTQARQAFDRFRATEQQYQLAARHYTAYNQRWVQAGEPGRPLGKDEQSAAVLLKSVLDSWGLGSLLNKAQDLLREGWDAQAIQFQLEDTPEYKKRFAANEDRKKVGLPVLSPADYIQTEAQYRNVLRSYGLPPGFYDSHDDVRKFLSADVSPSELAQRAQSAQQLFLTGDPEYRRIWKDFYGLSDGAAIASLLDPKRALPIIQQQQAATQIAAAARRQSLDTDRARAEQLAGLGVDEQSALKGYSDIAGAYATDQVIAARFGTDFSLSDEENDRLLGLASAQRKRRELYGQETALFNAGRPAASQASLSESSAGKY